MDMNCRKCGEPWDWFFIRDDVLGDEEDFQKMGKEGGVFDDGMGVKPGPQWQFSPGPYIIQCPACFGKVIHRSEEDKERQAIANAISDVLGDDIDGFMAEMEDFGIY